MKTHPKESLTLLFLSGSLVAGRHVHNTVGIDVEHDLNLWHTARCRRDSYQCERTQHLVVSGHLALALVDLDLDLGLTISGWNGTCNV